MTEPDHTALAEALQAGDLAGTSDALDLELDEQAVTVLRKLAKEGPIDGQPGLPRLLALLFRAAHSPEGSAHAMLSDRSWRTHILAVRWIDDQGKPRVSLGVSWDKVTSIGGAWPSLKAWSRKPAEHQPAAKAWAQEPRQLSIAIRPRTQALTDPADHGAALLAAVLAAPDDDAPRLVYADWLLERGDVRGELIRLDCRHAIVGDVSDEGRMLRKRIAQILQASAAAVMGEAAAYKPMIHRGFVDVVSMTITAFARHGERLFSGAPIRELRIKDPICGPDEPRKLAAIRALRLVRELSLTQTGFATYGPQLSLAPFAQCPHLERLRVLRLGRCGSSSEDWTELLENLHAPALEELYLEWNLTSPAIYRALARNRSLGRLRLIDELATTQLETSDAGKKMAAALDELAAGRPSLESLRWRSLKDLGDDAVTTFFSATSKVSLRELELDRCPIQDAAIARIASSPRSARLERLSLHHTKVGLDGIRALLRSAHATRLSVLDLAWDEENMWTAEALNECAELLVALPAEHPLRQVKLPTTYLIKSSLFERLKRFGITRS
jgi:uncharacterized protein (TIGR02996 family)